MVIHSPNCATLESGRSESRFAPVVLRGAQAAWGLELSAMSDGRVRRLVSYTAETVIAFAANAANSVQYAKVPVLGVVATLLAVAAVPIFIRADMPSVGANSTLRCYDRAGDYQPCPERVNASLSRFNGLTTASYRPASWASTALYLQESQATAADQPADAKTNAPATRRITAPRKRTALTACGRRPLPCVFSAFRREVTHLAYVAATEARALPGRGLKERYRPKDL